MDLNYTTASYTLHHHKTIQTVNGTDQITGITVGRTKYTHSSTIEITMDLLDASSTILDQGTGTLPTASGSFSQALSPTLGTVPYDKVAKIDVTDA